nr:hypothetical protein BaRGS_030712 [Batillaria attramentaria]
MMLMMMVMMMMMMMTTTTTTMMMTTTTGAATTMMMTATAVTGASPENHVSLVHSTCWGQPEDYLMAEAAAFFSFSWEFGEALCKLVNYTQNFSMICSVLTLTVISLESTFS